MAVATAGTAELVAGSANGTLALIVSPVAIIAGLVTAASAAYYIIASKPLLADYGFVSVTAWSFLFGSLVAVPAGFVPSPGYSILGAGGASAELIALVGFIVVVGTLLSFLLYFKGLERISPTEAAIVSAVEPVSAAAVSFFVLHVILTPYQYAGGVLIFCAVALIVFRPGARRGASPPNSQEMEPGRALPERATEGTPRQATQELSRPVVQAPAPAPRRDTERM